jgi:PBP1b-binding outer membrane lipoprotein LpoB
MKKILVSTILAVIILAGCQNSMDEQNKQIDTTIKNTNLENHGEPFSTGPTTPPAVKGPATPPPQAQAVTKNENIRLTLPLKSPQS